MVIAMAQIQLPRPISAGAPHRAISMHTGHYRLCDGSLLRVDVELGRFVGTYYTPDMHVETQVHGSEATVHAWVDAIAARHPGRPALGH
jgi:acetyltransferase-like isoleucine patch superfamily enzyme